MWIELLYNYYGGEYLIWALVCKRWHKFLTTIKKVRKVTHIKHIHTNIKIYEWSRYPQNFKNAVLYGDMALVNTMYSGTGQLFNPKSVFTAAVERGNVEIVKFLNEEKCVHEIDVMATAARNGHLDVVKYLISCGHNMSAWCCTQAAIGRHYDIVLWLLEKGCPWDMWVLAAAIKNKNIEMLEKFIKMGCPVDKYLMSCAAREGNIEALELLKKCGCPHEFLHLHVIMDNRLDSLKWLIENLQPIPVSHISYGIDIAREHNYGEMLEYLLDLEA
jgi:hypothetical protein